MVSEHIRKMTGWHWIGLYGAILLGVLYAMSLFAGMRAIYGAVRATLVSQMARAFSRLFLMVVDECCYDGTAARIRDL